MKSTPNQPCELYTRSRAHGEGLSDGAIRRLVDAGALVTLRRGIYVRADDLARTAEDPAALHALHIRALCTALSRHRLAAAGSSAARILGLDFLDEPARKLVVVTDDPGVAGTARNGYVLRVAPLSEDHLRRLHGASLTSPARTVLDLCAELEFVAGVVVADSAARRGLVTPADLTALLDASVGRPGVRRARACLGFVDPASESPLESASRAVLHRLGLPAPRTQVLLRAGSGAGWRVDFLWAELGVIGEADGLEKYIGDGRMETLRAIREEKAREAELLQMGYEIVRWGWREVREPTLLEARVGAALQRGAERLRGRGA